MFCSQCGYMLDEADKFCPKCGEGAASLSKNGKQVKIPRTVKKAEKEQQTGQQAGQQTWRQRRRQKRLKWEMAHPIYSVPYNIGNFGMLAGIVMAVAGWFISNDLGGILGKVWNTLSSMFNGSTSMAGILKEVLFGKYSESGLTALSIIYPLQLLMIAIAVGTGVGINTAMAHYLGVHDEKKQMNMEESEHRLLWCYGHCLRSCVLYACRYMRGCLPIRRR